MKVFCEKAALNFPKLTKKTPAKGNNFLVMLQKHYLKKSLSLLFSNDFQKIFYKSYFIITLSSCFQESKYEKAKISASITFLQTMRCLHD